MDVDTIIRVLGALGGTGGIAAAYSWVKAQGRAEAMAEQVQKTIVAKDAEIAALRAEIAQQERWIDALTRPPERSR
jgi:hypothetical protein